MVLDGISLEVRPGEFVAVFGPNGCGKTTFLNIVAGILAPSSGSASVNGRPAGQAPIGYVIQDYRASLLPWRTTVDNLSLVLELRGIGCLERRGTVTRFLEDLGLNLPTSGYPYELSGGQQQLVAICRSPVGAPELLLLDEPFSALDYTTRLFMHDQLLRIWEKTGTTVLFVSHDLEEALYLADRLVLLSRRPARVLETLMCDLGRPRSPALLESEAFSALRSVALGIFRQAVGHAT